MREAVAAGHLANERSDEPMTTTGDPRVTVGVPVYNGERYLALALDSILAQTETDLEILVADNASTDGTRAIIERFAVADSRVRPLWSETNEGAAWNYNRLVEAARGVYFKWAPHDDLCRPEFIERCANELDADPTAVLAYPQTAVIAGEGCPAGEESDDLDLRDARASARFRRFVERYRATGTCNPVLGVARTSVLRRTSLIGPYPASDMILLAELCLLGPFREVPERLFLRRRHPEASMKNASSAELVQWFDPTAAPARSYRRLTWLCAFHHAIQAAGLRAAERWRCRRHLLRWCWWNRWRLSKELRRAIADRLRGRSAE
jgi:glycosyltransferase involved in cell wall biosynthesis